MTYFRIDLVNKQQFEDTDLYKEVKITLPKTDNELIKDFEYLELDYNNLSIQDTHIKECEVVCQEDLDFSKSLTKFINHLINDANEKGLTTTFQEIKKLNSKIINLQLDDRDKLVAIIEAKDGYITDLKTLTKYVESIKFFELEENILSNEEYARWLYDRGEIDTYDLIDYIDFESFGNDYAEENNAVVTDKGMLIQLNSDLDYQIHNEEEEEEFE